MAKTSIQANRRMISSDVIFNDDFMRLANETKVLYFYMISVADDDGFVSNCRDLIKRVDVSEIHFDYLLRSGFVLISEDGKVYVITDWLKHNKVRNESYYFNRLDCKKEIGIGEDGRYQYIALMGEDEPSLYELIEANGNKAIPLTQLSRKKESLLTNGVINQEDNSDRTNFVREGNVLLEEDKNSRRTIGKVRLDEVRLGEGSAGHSHTSIQFSSDGFYGADKNVYLTNDEYLTLANRYIDVNRLIDKVGAILLSTNSKTSKNHFAFINKVAIEDGWKTFKDIEELDAKKEMAELQRKEVEELPSPWEEEEMDKFQFTSLEEAKKKQREAITALKKVSPALAKKLIEQYETKFNEKFELD